MSTKYHISPSTGNPNKCYAHKKPCPVGGESEHYPTKEAAREAFEKKQEGRKNPLTSIKKVSDGSSISSNPRDYGLSHEDLAKVDAYMARRKKDKLLDPGAENDLRRSMKGSISAARHLEKAWGGKTQFLNESLIQRVQYKTTGVDVQLQGSTNGKVYFRVLGSSHRTGYDPHEGGQWTVVPSGNVGGTVERTVESYMNDYKTKQEEGRKRVAAWQEKESKRKTEEVKKATKENTFNATNNYPQPVATSVEPPVSVKGPRPESTTVKYPPSSYPSYKCTHCGDSGSHLMRESLAEGNQGYSSCCNEPLEGFTERAPSSYETVWGSQKDADEFLRANGIRSYSAEERQGKYHVVSTIPGTP